MIRFEQKYVSNQRGWNHQLAYLLSRNFWIYINKGSLNHQLVPLKPQDFPREPVYIYVPEFTVNIFQPFV